jgi:hypothetical protein
MSKKNKPTRREARIQRVQIRQENRTIRQGNRSQTRQVAYENGIDPYASAWGGISSLGQSAGQTLSSIYGAPTPTVGAWAAGGAESNQPSNMYLILGAVGLGLVLLLKK